MHTHISQFTHGKVTLTPAQTLIACIHLSILDDVAEASLVDCLDFVRLLEGTSRIVGMREEWRSVGIPDAVTEAAYSEIKRRVIDRMAIRTGQLKHKAEVARRAQMTADLCILHALYPNRPFQQDEIAEVVGLSRVRICQIEKEALEKLQRLAIKEGITREAMLEMLGRA